MKKSILLLLTLMLAFAASACSNSSETNFEVAGVSVSYGKPIKLAKEEFETIFAEYEGLKITEHVLRIQVIMPKISNNKNC